MNVLKTLITSTSRTPFFQNSVPGLLSEMTGEY